MNEKNEINPVILPAHVYLLLRDKPTLLAFYMDLCVLDSISILESKKQKELAEILSVSVPHISKQCKELSDLNLLERANQGREVAYKIVYPKQCADREYLMELLSVNSIDNNKKIGKKVNYLTKKIQKATRGKDTKKVKLSNILNIYNLNILNNYNKNNRFPKADYDEVLAAYEKYTGAKRQGPELTQARKAIRLMFLAKRKTEDIISFMKWLYFNAGEGDLKWLHVWDMWFVQKHLPDFLAGRYKDSYDDGFRDLG